LFVGKDGASHKRAILEVRVEQVAWALGDHFSCAFENQHIESLCADLSRRAGRAPGVIQTNVGYSFAGKVK